MCTRNKKRGIEENVTEVKQIRQPVFVTNNHRFTYNSGLNRNDCYETATIITPIYLCFTHQPKNILKYRKTGIL